MRDEEEESHDNEGTINSSTFLKPSKGRRRLKVLKRKSRGREAGLPEEEEKMADIEEEAVKSKPQPLPPSITITQSTIVFDNRLLKYRE